MFWTIALSVCVGIVLSTYLGFLVMKPPVAPSRVTVRVQRD
jgi:hypothetical protein